MPQRHALVKEHDDFTLVGRRGVQSGIGLFERPQGGCRSLDLGGHPRRTVHHGRRQDLFVAGLARGVRIDVRHGFLTILVGQRQSAAGILNITGQNAGLIHRRHGIAQFFAEKRATGAGQPIVDDLRRFGMIPFGIVIQSVKRLAAGRRGIPRIFAIANLVQPEHLVTGVHVIGIGENIAGMALVIRAIAPMPGAEIAQTDKTVGINIYRPAVKTLAVNLHVLRPRAPGHGDDGWVQSRVQAFPIIDAVFAPHIFRNAGKARKIRVFRVIRIKRTGEQNIRRQFLQHPGPGVELVHRGLPAVGAEPFAAARAALAPAFRIVGPAAVHRVYANHFEITCADEFGYPANMLARQLIPGPAIITPALPLTVIDAIPVLEFGPLSVVGAVSDAGAFPQHRINSAFDGIIVEIAYEFPVIGVFRMTDKILHRVMIIHQIHFEMQHPVNARPVSLHGILIAQGQRPEPAADAHGGPVSIIGLVIDARRGNHHLVRLHFQHLAQGHGPV